MHNIDFFYGAPVKDADRAKGDGSIDLKAGTDYVTASYNHFGDSGKSCVACSTDGSELIATSNVTGADIFELAEKAAFTKENGVDKYLTAALK